MPLSRQTIQYRQDTLVPMLTAKGWSRYDAVEIAADAARAATRGEAYEMHLTQDILDGTLTVDLSGKAIEMKTALAVER